MSRSLQQDPGEQQRGHRVERAEHGRHAEQTEGRRPGEGTVGGRIPGADTGQARQVAPAQTSQSGEHHDGDDHEQHARRALNDDRHADAVLTAASQKHEGSAEAECSHQGKHD